MGQVHHVSASTADRKTGPTVPKSTVLSAEDEAVIVALPNPTVPDGHPGTLIRQVLVDLQPVDQFGNVVQGRPGAAFARNSQIIAFSAASTLAFHNDSGRPSSDTA
jgi:hypothetical protein